MEALSRLVIKACEAGLYKPLRVGRDEVVVSHLQYADDTIFFGEAIEENIVHLKCILRCFE